ncbi:MAG: LamG domain-containing protein, partial [Candidatus Aenigmarchaeota archaeon]|nr:LamG domain-containing protein [Candidatus Aenigmarchaeota archaeon]
SSINLYLQTCSADDAGYCAVPFVFYSDSAGILEIYDMDIRMNESESIATKLPETAVNDSIEWLFYATDFAGNTNASITRTMVIDTTDPYIRFVSPTQDNNTYWNKSWAEANITTDDTHFDTFKFNWDNTNYSIYDESLVLLMNFNNNSVIGENSTYAVDISKYENNGTLYNSPNVSWTVDGKFDRAMEFNGTNGYVNAGGDSSLSITTEGTWMYWAKTGNHAETDHKIMGKCQLSSKGWVIGHPTENNDGLKLEYWNESGSQCVLELTGDGEDDLLNNWVHFTWVKNSTGVYFYRDGVYKEKIETGACATPIGATTSSYDLIIGTTPWSVGYRPFNGTIDEVRIYNRSLSAGEIQLHYISTFRKYNSTRYNFYVNKTGMDDGIYEYYGWANDTYGNSNQTETRILTIDTIAPIITNEAINNTDALVDAIIKLNATVTDDNLDTVIFRIQTPSGDYNITASNDGSEYYVLCSPSNSECNTSNVGTFNWTQVWANDSAGNINTTSPDLSFNTALCSVAVGMSSALALGINWDVISLPSNNLSAEGNNNTAITQYDVTVSIDGACTVDLYISADTNLTNPNNGKIIGLGNETYCYNATNNTVPGIACETIDT